jgi:protein TonB
MSYLDQAHDPRRRAAALATTAAVHAALGVAVVTGLTVAGYTPIDTYDPIVQFPVEQDPPEPTPPAPQPDDPVVTLPKAPEPPLVLQPAPGPLVKPLETTELALDETSRLPDPVATLTPRPQPSFTPKRAVPSNNSAGWISNDDYPRRALIDHAEGAVAYRLVIGTTGRVSSCELTRPSGHRALDDATCRLIASRARFEPATDETGAKVIGTFTGSVRWEIPE